jgi:pseudouridylate synthase
MNFNKSITELLSELCRFPSEHKIIRLPEEVASHSTDGRRLPCLWRVECVLIHTTPTREAKMRAWICFFLSQIWSNSVEGMTPTLYDGQCSSSSQQCPQKGVGSVALESTVISHGLPYPENLELALKMEGIVREYGMEPRTCGIVHGELIAGLSHEQIRYFATAKDENRKILKVSRRDLSYVVSKKLDGATTVASTMIIAEKSGIEVFATGGIGGVHRNWQDSLDISADLEELAKTAVIVVCAGAKAILDIPATLEYLETKGVTVIGYQTDYVPAFYSRQTSQNLRVHTRCDTPEEIVEIWLAKKQLGLSGGLLVMNPIPEEHEIPYEEIEPSIHQALQEAKLLGIHGAETTPFLLSKLKEITASKSVTSNLALLENNARLASQIAWELSKK